jgi:hypothetical protein
LAGALLAAVNGAKSAEQKEAWRSEGAAFFQRRSRSRKSAGQPAGDDARAEANGGGHGAS